MIERSGGPKKSERLWRREGRRGGVGVRSRPRIEMDGGAADERGDPFADLEGRVFGERSTAAAWMAEEVVKVV